MTVAIVRRKPNNKIAMEVSASSINSRATAIKTILLAAWRNKLPNEEWESKIRKVLPRGVNGDIYDLADCLLKQALIGPVPNQLFLNYLKHAVSCELVSHSAVLSSISNQPINLRMTSTLLHRTSPIICLLEFLKAFRDRISCKGTEVECLNLCHSLGELIHWLLKCIQQTVEYIIVNPPTNNNSQQQASAMTNSSTGLMSNSSNNNGHIGPNQAETLVSIINHCTETIQHFISRPFTKSLLFICKTEYSAEFDDNVLKLVHNIHQRLSSTQQLQYLNDKIQSLNSLPQLSVTFTSRDLHPSVVAAQQLRCLQTHRIRSTQITSGSNLERNRTQIYSSSPQVHDSDTNYALFSSLYPLVAFDAILRPARSNRHLARQIVTITNFTSAPIHTTYCELIRVCLIGLIDAHGDSKAKATWSFFTFLKLPRLLIELDRMFDRNQQQTNNCQLQNASNEPINTTSFVTDLRLAFERLCEYSPLLDEAEFKCNCDLIKCLVKELTKFFDKADPRHAQLKNLEFRKFPFRRPVTTSNSNNLPGGYMMLRTDSVVTHMLDTLNVEQKPNDLFDILRQSCSGISFEYTLSVAAATGRLHLFVKRLVKHNEWNKLPRDNLPLEHQQAQSLNFDITFLILIYIAQRYGPELVERDSSYTFNKWYYECYNQETRFDCPKEMLKNCNDEIVTSLIKQLIDQNEDFQLKHFDWNDACFNIPKAICEILNAWTQDHLKDEDIARVIERLRSKMCFMAVVASNWLLCHIKTLEESDKAKPLHILNGLSKASHLAKRQEVFNDVSDGGEEAKLASNGYSERSSLMGAIVKRICFELTPNRSMNNANSVVNGSSSIKQRGSGGSQTSNAPDDSESSQDEISYHSYKDRFISTLTTKEIFLANLKQCLSRGWIDYSSSNSISSLFKIIGSECFTNLIVGEALTSHESPSDLGRAVNITFGLFHLDIEACAFALLDNVIPDWLMNEKKQALLNQPRAFALANLAVMTIIEVYNNLTAASKRIKLSQHLGSTNGINEENSNANSSSDTDDINERLRQLDACISNLMRLFKEIMSDSVISHRTLFPVLFLQQTVVCAREDSSMITVHLQPEILLYIIDLFSSELTFELVLAISNMSTTRSRKYTAKSVCKLAQLMSAADQPVCADRGPSVGAYTNTPAASTTEVPMTVDSVNSGVQHFTG